MSAARQALLLGVVTGMRSALPLALLTRDGPPALRRATVLAAAGELVGDKLPRTPSRTAAGPFGGRVVLGALAGGVVHRRGGLGVARGALLGAAGATAGTLAGYHARAWLGRSTPVPDAVWGAVEDVVAVRLARAALD